MHPKDGLPVTQERLAKELGVDKKTVSAWLRQEIAPKGRELGKLAKRFQTSVSWLMAEPGAPPKWTRYPASDSLSTALEAFIERQLGDAGGAVDGQRSVTELNALDGERMLVFLTQTARNDLQRWNEGAGRIFVAEALARQASQLRELSARERNPILRRQLARDADSRNQLATMVGASAELPKLQCFAPLPKERRELRRAIEKALARELALSDVGQLAHG